MYARFKMNDFGNYTRIVHLAGDFKHIHKQEAAKSFAIHFYLRALLLALSWAFRCPFAPIRIYNILMSHILTKYGFRCSVKISHKINNRPCLEICLYVRK